MTVTHYSDLITENNIYGVGIISIILLYFVIPSSQICEFFNVQTGIFICHNFIFQLIGVIIAGMVATHFFGAEKITQILTVIVIGFVIIMVLQNADLSKINTEEKIIPSTASEIPCSNVGECRQYILDQGIPVNQIDYYKFTCQNSKCYLEIIIE